MSKPIRIFIAILVLLFGCIGADCLFGFAIGGNLNIISTSIFLAFALVLGVIAMAIIFGTEMPENTIEIFAVIVIAFMMLCIMAYMPMNRLSGNGEYVEKQVEVVEVYTRGRGRILFLDPDSNVTVKEKNGETYEIGDYTPTVDYDIGDDIIIREYKGGFDLNYYDIISSSSQEKI